MEPHVFEPLPENSDSSGGDVSITSTAPTDSTSNDGATNDPFATITATGGADHEEVDGPLATSVDVEGVPWVDQLLADTRLTRDDLELLVRAAGAAAAVGVLVMTYREA